MSGASIWAALKQGESLSVEESLTVGNAIDFPNGIRFARVYVGERVERIVFADGATFIREKEDV